MPARPLPSPRVRRCQNERQGCPTRNGTAASASRADASANERGGRLRRVEPELFAATQTGRHSRYARLNGCAERFADVVIVGDRQNDARSDGGLKPQAGAHQSSGMDQHAGRGTFVETVALKVAGPLRDGDEGPGKLGRASVSGWMTTVVSCRASTISSR